jgi:L-threonylcarbamoyladenylate synthase
MRYKHYAPGCQVRVIENNLESLLKQYTAENKKIGILATQEYVLENYSMLQNFRTVILDRGSTHMLIQAAQRLYQLYRKADQIGLEVLLVEHLTQSGLGFTIMNRVRKSAE